ncbi:diguanylate cyclase domain-containing protein [Variovorax sp. ZT4R33]|uniref:sensor domain-containing diguanylate cyclase n=1 Tax=Variovorax sp. ZT4R33 TaxID=3443743 RepID=UPI003F47D803
MNGNADTGHPAPLPGPSSDPASLEAPSDLAPLEQPDPYRGSGNLLRWASLLVVFVCLALLATNTWIILRARAQEIAQTERANTNLARAVTDQVEGTIAEVDHILEGIVFELERHGLAQAALEQLQPVLVNQVAAVGALKGLFVYDASGRWIVHSEPTVDPTRNNADRDYFRFHKDNASARTRVGAPIVSRSSGEWVLPVSRRLNDPDGKFDGVALATVSVRHLRSLLDKYDVGRRGAIAVALPDRLVVRKPFSEGDIGRATRASALVTVFASQRSGTVVGTSSIDGVERIISFEHMQNYPLRITVAVSKDDVLQDWRTASYLQSAWALLLYVIVAWSGSSVILAMRRRIDAETGLRDARDALAQANERLSHLAQYDGLTGLPNRRYFDARLLRLFGRAQRAARPLAVVLVDVDQFKSYNDCYGHVEGDECLRRVAQALRSVARRPGDFIARYGGEEFAMLLPGTDADGAAQLAEAARAAVLGLQIPHEGTDLGRVSISLGVAAGVPGVDTEPYGLVRAADALLYLAKRDGRNRVHTQR